MSFSDDTDDEPAGVLDGPITAEHIQEALTLLIQLSGELSAVATGSAGNERRYEKRRRRVNRILKRVGIPSPYPWDSLRMWEAHAKSEYPQNYAGRRNYIASLTAPVREQLQRRLDDASSGDIQAAVTEMGNVADKSLNDSSAIRAELQRLESLLITDPGAAIGKAKNLVEATAKAVLGARSKPVMTHCAMPKLVAAAMRELGIHPDQLTDNHAEHEPVAITISELVRDLALTVNTFRNKAGDGHGPNTAVTGLDLRHGRLAARAAIAWSAYMLDTLHDQDHSP